MAFEAKFHQSCASCGEDVKGEPARYDGNDLVHDDCESVEPYDPTALRQTETVCTTCWLVKPCECEVD